MTAHANIKAATLTEEQLQSQVAQYLDAVSRNGSLFFWCHVPNGGHRDIRVARKLKAQGVKKGVWDCLIVGKGARLYWIELKRAGRRGQKAGGLSEAQTEFKQKLVALGVSESRFAVADSLDGVQTALRQWQLL